MNAKTDRKALLRSSIKNEAESVEKRFPTSNVDKRYADADGALEGRPNGLVGPKYESTNIDFSAEINNKNQERTILRIPISTAHDNPLNARQIYDGDVMIFTL